MPDAFLPPIFDRLKRTLDCLKLAPDSTIEKLTTFDELIKQLQDQDPDPVSPHYWKSFEALVAPKRLEYGQGLSVTWSTPTAPDPGKFEPPWTGQPAPGNQDFRNFFAGPAANPKPWPGRLWNPNRQVILAQVTDEINELVRNGQLSGTQREYILRFDLDGKFDHVRTVNCRR